MKLRIDGVYQGIKPHIHCPETKSMERGGLSLWIVQVDYFLFLGRSSRGESRQKSTVQNPGAGSSDPGWLPNLDKRFSRRTRLYIS
jgi:hypothetical protein